MSARRLLIDADIARYEIGAVAQNKEEHFGVVTWVPSPRHIVEGMVDNWVEKIMENTGSDSYEIFLSGSTNFRTEIAVTNVYKGQRHADKPIHWPTVGEILRERYDAYTVHGAEADDVLSIFARQDPENVVIASRDKDLRIVPCWHYSWKCGESQPEIPVHKVDLMGWVEARPYPSGGYKLVGCGLRFFYGQVLCGDSVDNYKGCPNVGPKAAVKALVGCNNEVELYEATLRLFVTKLGPEEGSRLLTENARLAWLLDDAEVTYNANDIYVSPRSLWQPPEALPAGESSGPVAEPSLVMPWDFDPTEPHQWTERTY